mgnify:CR=1 FL=1
MNKRTLTAAAIALVFALAIAAPVFAQSMSHSVDYNLNGTITLDKTVGHFCNTGAEMKQEIRGAGTMTKSTDLYMEEGYLDVDDNNDWIAAADSSLSVMTAIKLCAPAKHVYADTARAVAAGMDGEVVPVEDLYSYGLDLLDPNDEAYFEALTSQIWAARVSADPGFSGQLNTDFQAASGPYSDTKNDKSFGWWPDADDNIKLTSGKDFVGQYFNIDQFARTSQGTTQRYIDISSPFSHAYLHEDMTVVGMAEVAETFSMMNVKKGAEVTTKWWDVF